MFWMNGALRQSLFETKGCKAGSGHSGASQVLILITGAAALCAAWPTLKGGEEGGDDGLVEGGGNFNNSG